MRQHFRRRMSPVKLCASVCKQRERWRESKKQKVLVVYCICICVCMCVNVFGICRMRQADKILFAAQLTYTHARTECCGKATCVYASKACAYISACILCFTRQSTRHTKKKQKQRIIVQIIKRKCGKYNACISRQHKEDREREKEPKQLRQLKQAAARTGNKLKAKATTTSATPSTKTTTTATRATLSAYKCQRGSALLP